MKKTVEFLFDFTSAPSYIAWKCIGPMADAVNAEVAFVPVLLGGIFKATGNAGPMGIPAKEAWYRGDLALWCRKRDVAINPSRFLPLRSLDLMRGCFVASERGELARYADVVFDAIFLHGKNMADMGVVEQVLNDAGLVGAEYRLDVGREDIKRQLLLATNGAVARGVFGLPTFFVRDRLFFGQDRLEFVMDAIRES